MAQAAGYSGKPLPEKLGIKPGTRLALRNEPPGFREVSLADGMPPGVLVSADLPAEVALVFATELSALKAGFEAAIAAAPEGAAVWVVWPKKASGVRTDITEDKIRETCLPSGWVDVKVCAVDATWSGLKFLRRRLKR